MIQLYLDKNYKGKKKTLKGLECHGRKERILSRGWETASDTAGDPDSMKIKKGTDLQL